MYQINLTQDMVQWLVIVKRVIKTHVPLNMGKFIE